MPRRKHGVHVLCRRTSLARLEQAAEKAEILASSFDKLRVRLSDFNGLDFMVSLSHHGQHGLNFSDPGSRFAWPG